MGSLVLYKGAGTRYCNRGRCAVLREGSREGREIEGWGRGQFGSSTDPVFQVFSLSLHWGNHRMVVLFGRVLDLTMKLEVVISVSSGMASRELADDAMVIGSIDGRELISMKSCGSLISTIVVSLKYLVSLGKVDLVRDSLWNMGGGGGQLSEGITGFSNNTGRDSLLAGALDFSRSNLLFSAHPCILTCLLWKHQHPLKQ